MKIEALRVWTARLLLGFVLVTIGFAVVRRTAPLPPSDFDAEQPDRPERTHQVAVYAAHMTFRCPECNQIEWYARELIESEFAAELAEGRLVFRSVDYMRDKDFARRYNIASSTLVVARLEDGKETGFQRLDEVWTKVRNREDYFAYVRDAIRRALDGGDGQDGMASKQVVE